MPIDDIFAYIFKFIILSETLGQGLTEMKDILAFAMFYLQQSCVTIQTKKRFYATLYIYIYIGDLISIN